MLILTMMTFLMFKKSIGMQMEICDTVCGFNVTSVLKKYYYRCSVLPIGTTQRNRDDEILKLLQADTNDDTDQAKVW